ncbi:MAG: hypothetical protein MdMp014T_2315 [Treponematales bacterium]
MSANEQKVAKLLEKQSISYVTQKNMPLEGWPWKTKKSKKSPTCDFYLPDQDIYVEVKGFMTIEAVEKIKFLCKQDFKYYCLQTTEGKDWPETVENQIAELKQGTLDYNKITLVGWNNTKKLKKKSLEGRQNLRKYVPTPFNARFALRRGQAAPPG